MFDNSLTGIIVLVSAQLIAQLFQSFKEWRNRKWDIEDRRVKAIEVKHALASRADDVANVMATEAGKLAVKTDAQTLQLLGELEKSTFTSTAALTEANRTNAKIRDLNERMDSMLTEMRQGRCNDNECQDRT